MKKDLTERGPLGLVLKIKMNRSNTQKAKQIYLDRNEGWTGIRKSVHTVTEIWMYPSHSSARKRIESLVGEGNRSPDDFAAETWANLSPWTPALSPNVENYLGKPMAVVGYPYKWLPGRWYPYDSRLPNCKIIARINVIKLTNRHRRKVSKICRLDLLQRALRLGLVALDLGEAEGREATLDDVEAAGGLAAIAVPREHGIAAPHERRPVAVQLDL